MLKYSGYLSLLFAFFTIVGISGLHSCQPMGSHSELKKIDTLKSWVEEANEKLDVQVNVQRRHDSIQIRMNYISENMPHISSEQQSILTEYRAVGRVYNNYLQNRAIVVEDNKTHRERIENLEKDVRAGRIEDDEFAEIYEEERRIIERHLFDARQLVAPISEVESTYRRTNPQIHEMYIDLLARR